VARGAALRVETLDEAIRLFAPTDPRELIDGIENNSSMVCDRARKALERYRSDPHVVEIVWRVTSQQDLIARGCSLTQDAGKTLHVALWHEEFDALLPSLLEAMVRGVKIALVLYSFHPGIRKLQKLKAAALQHSQSKRQVVPVLGRQFVLVADGERCITGSIFPNQRVEGVFTLNRGLVTNAIDLVNHEIYLERIIAEVGKPIWDIFGKTLHKLNAFDPFKGK
jgi:sugar-specific transcriptional regulator TrmB